MFNTLRQLGKAVPVPEMDEGVYLCAASDGKGKAALMVSNISGKPWNNNLDFGRYKITEVRILDDTHLNEPVGDRLESLENDSVCLLLLEKR